MGGLASRDGEGEGGEATAVVLDAHGDCGGAVGGGDLCWVGGVYVDDLVGGGVVGGAGGDAQEVFVCHRGLDTSGELYAEGSQVIRRDAFRSTDVMR